MERKCNQCKHFYEENPWEGEWEKECGEKDIIVHCLKGHFKSISGFKTKNFINTVVKTIELAKDCDNFCEINNEESNISVS